MTGYAHFDPAWDPVKDEIVCAEYHLKGKKLVRMPGQPNTWKLRNLYDGIKELPGYSGRNLVSEPNTLSKFTIQPYSSWANAINPHSWVVTASDPYYGIEIRSNNILNSVSMAAGYEINRYTRAKGPYIGANFGMWFPQFNLGFSNVTREITFEDGQESRSINNRFTAGVSVPLVFTPGVYKQDLIVGVDYTTGFKKLNPHIPGFVDVNFNYASGSLILVNSRKQGYRQIMPSFAQRLDVYYSHQLSGVPISRLYTSGDLSLPTIWPSNFSWDVLP